MIVIVDYGMGNLGSVYNMLKKVGTEAIVSSDPDLIAKADKLILPGVGAFDNGMKNLEARGLREILNRKVLTDGVPVLGICLGVQLFTHGSEEGTLHGLGWIDAETVRFRFPSESTGLKVPHMGWNSITVKLDHPLLKGFDEPPRFYFVHSYHVHCHDPGHILATATYGIEFTAAVVYQNVIGTQFHPEKSHKFGLKVLENFAKM